MNKADALKYKALKKALEKGDAKILIDTNKLNKPDSPVYNPWEVLLPILAPTLLGLVLILSVGTIFGLLFMATMIFISNTIIRKYLYTNLIKRAKEYMQSSFNNLDTLWQYGGIILVNTKDKKTGCIAPQSSWKDFVTLNFAHYMTEKPTNDDSEKGSQPKQSISA